MAGMSKQTSRPKKKASGKGSRLILEFTRKQLFLGLGLAFLAMAWMFTLGILVGRGLSPVRFDVQKLKKELIALKQEALKRDQARFKIETDNLSENPDLDFYKVLTDKKEEARIKSAKDHERTTKSHMIPLKISMVNKTGRPGLLTIQVASLQSSKQARRVIDRLKSKGYEAYESRVSVPGKGTYHRVRVGHFENSSEASRVAARLKKDQLDILIVRE